MKVLLISPPGLSPFSPPLSIISLAAYLRTSNIDVDLIDASINGLHFNTSPDRLLNKVEQSRKLLRDKAHHFPASLVEQFLAIERDIEPLIKKIVELWRPDRFILDATTFESDIAAIDTVVLFSSLIHMPTLCGICTYRGDINMINDSRLNPFFDYFTEELIPEIERINPDLVGVSISYETQFPFANALMKEFELRWDTPMVVGGSYFTMLCDQVTHNRSVMTQINSEVSKSLATVLKPFGVCGEGEETLVRLCNELTLKTEIPGLIRYDTDQKVFIYTQRKEPLNSKLLPVISLEGLPIGKKYLSHINIAPLMTSRGCYWNRCTFCDHAAILDSKWREQHVETILSNLIHYQESYHINAVFFCDESMSPRLLRELSAAILKQGLHIRFGTMIRFEKNLVHNLELAAKAGCVFLSFGFESGSPRVVSKMNKGYDHGIAQKILDECARHRISVEVHVMFGFPGESHLEAQQTIAFLERNVNTIDIIRTNPWFLTPGSSVFKNKEMYGVELASSGFVPMNPNSYRIREGISHEEALGYIKKVSEHPALGQKLLRRELLGAYTEEYYFIKKQCQVLVDKNECCNAVSK